jgi:hypothetical protein
MNGRQLTSNAPVTKKKSPSEQNTRSAESAEEWAYSDLLEKHRDLDTLWKKNL